MSKTLKIEAFSGASGDMFLGALAGLADAYEELKEIPRLLKFEEEAEIKISEVNRNGIVCKHVKVIEVKHQHHHRHLTDIVKIIDSSKLSDGAKKIALDIFNIIGKAESAVHGIPIEKIHFHEVGAVDSIIDICGCAYLLDRLDIEKSFLPELVTGKGFVKTAHGMLPVPCPATKLIIEGIPFIMGDEDGEKLTPTGAAIIKYLNPDTKLPKMKDLKTSYGPGEKEFQKPNVLRLSLSEEVESSNNEVLVIETNIDDSSGENLGLEFQNNLIDVGAIDFYFTQVIMKKGRPGTILSAICHSNKLEQVSDFILKYTSTIGLRYYNVNRVELERKIEEVDTEFGKFRVKVTMHPDGSIKVKPESEEVQKIAYEKNINPNILYQKIVSKYEEDK